MFKIISSSILFLSICFFILGLYYPILSTKQEFGWFTVDYQSVRLFDSIKMFYQSNDFLLAAVIFIFSILLPIFEFLLLFSRIFIIFDVSKNTKIIFHLLDKWSMLDVFLVALLLLNFKMNSSIIVMKIQIGTTYIAISVVLRMTVALFINYKEKRNEV